MILASSGIIASSISGVDADWLAYYNRVIAAGGSLTTTEQNATKQLVADLKANSLWTPMKAIYPMVGASAAACAQNLKSSSFTGTFTSGVTFQSQGIKGNGVNAYFDTTVKPSTSLSLNSTHISFYCNQVPTLSVYGTNLMGTRLNYNARLLITPSYPFENGTFYTSNNSYEVSRGNIINTNLGFFINSRINSTNIDFYRNQTKYSYSDNSINLDTGNIYLLSANTGDNSYVNNSRCAFASIGDGLLDAQASNFYTAVQAFNQTLNRQIAP